MRSCSKFFLRAGKIVNRLFHFCIAIAHDFGKSIKRVGMNVFVKRIILD